MSATRCTCIRGDKFRRTVLDAECRANHLREEIEELDQ